MATTISKNEFATCSEICYSVSMIWTFLTPKDWIRTYFGFNLVFASRWPQCPQSLAQMSLEDTQHKGYCHLTPLHCLRTFSL